MKKTAIQINMINKNDNSNNNGEPLMTSIEIATLTGKQHKDVLKAIRNMESAWAQVAGRKFALGSYEDLNNQSRPCYFLSKTECLYIATKFNDEARARLVLRWEELERSEKIKVKSEKVQRPKEIRLLACDEEVLDEADDILGEELEELNKYSKFCYTPSEIGKPFGLEGRDLNSSLGARPVATHAEVSASGLDGRPLPLHPRTGRTQKVGGEPGMDGERTRIRLGTHSELRTKN